MNDYQDIQKELARGWNTWHTRSVLSHVLLPEGFAINLGLKEYNQRCYLKEALIGRKEPDAEQIQPGPHAYNGSYTELTLTWKGIEVIVQSATEEDDLVILVTPLKLPGGKKAPRLVAELGLLWGLPGKLIKSGDTLVGESSKRTAVIYAANPTSEDSYIPNQGPYLAFALEEPVGLSTGCHRDVGAIGAIIDRRRREQAGHVIRYEELTEIYQAIQSVLAWNTVYEPEQGRVITPVSRLYNVHWGGFVLFEWDTFFAALMASLDNRELAYANVIEILRGKTEAGFVPNEVFVCQLKSRGWSQPPVGSWVVREIYRRFRERWFLEAVFDDLLSWNRWWEKRRVKDGLLCWGADPYTPILDCPYEYEGMNAWQGAAWESGLDNSPMYDEVPFDTESHLMMQADVGLNALYVADCLALGEIAKVLGKTSEASELAGRAGLFSRALATLWDENRGLYLNRRTDTGEFSPRISPTMFYPLLCPTPRPEQARRLVKEHLYNPEEFWGDWVLPSIARNDPAFNEQDYWRGRIWGPMNFLTYLGLRRSGFREECAELAEKSMRLLLTEWHEKRHVHENFHAILGVGCDRPNSDRFYHWGGLLGLPALIEAGYYEDFDTSVS